jgi:hypothetical protein
MLAKSGEIVTRYSTHPGNPGLGQLAAAVEIRRRAQKSPVIQKFARSSRKLPEISGPFAHGPSGAWGK